MAGIIAFTTKKGERFNLTSEHSHLEVVTLAVFLEGGDKRSVDTEDVAIRAHQIAPGRFSWKKYPDRVNLEIVRVYLSDAKKPEKGALVDGSGRTGWNLTPAGLGWAREAAQGMLGQDLSRGREQGKGGSIDERRWRREHERLVGTSAWIKWSEGRADAITPREAAEVFRIDSYADADRRMSDRKITRVRGLFVQDPDVAAFLDVVERRLDDRESGA